MFSLYLKIDRLPKTINAIGRSHWAIKAKEAKEWRHEVDYLCYGKRPPRPLERAFVRYVRHSARAPDADGLVSSFKHVQDGLITAGIIEDDKWVNIGMPIYEWVKCPQKSGFIEIFVTETVPQD